MPHTMMPFFLLLRHNIRLVRRLVQGTEPGPPPYIMNLPTELLKHIASFLPPSSAAVFSISSYELEKALGTMDIERCNNNSIQGRLDRHEMLELLSYDLESLIACVHCQKLHSVSLKPVDSSEKTNRKCEAAETALQVSFYFHWGFRLTSIQMATKLFKMGKDPTPYLNSMSRTTREHHYERDHTTYLIHETRICDGIAIFRSQVWCLMPGSDLEELDADSKTHGFENSSFMLCRHMLYHGNNEVKKAYLCHCKHLLDGYNSCTSCSMLRKCNLCDTEFHVGSKDYGSKGVAIIVTKWSNMGSVRSTKDPKIQALLHESTSVHGVPNATLGFTMRTFEGIGGSAIFLPTLKPAQEEAFLLPQWKWK